MLNSAFTTNFQVRTESGKALAEWVMDHRTELGLKYVIWGQRIWDIRNDDVKPWAQWDFLGDRGSITANHWFVSFSVSLKSMPVLPLKL